MFFSIGIIPVLKKVLHLNMIKDKPPVFYCQQPFHDMDPWGIDDPGFFVKYNQSSQVIPVHLFQKAFNQLGHNSSFAIEHKIHSYLSGFLEGINWTLLSNFDKISDCVRHQWSISFQHPYCCDYHPDHFSSYSHSYILDIYLKKYQSVSMALF